MNRGWSESPFLAGNVRALSPEARDLLDRIFVVDPARRITVAQIMRHPWCVRRAGGPLHAGVTAGLCSPIIESTCGTLRSRPARGPQAACAAPRIPRSQRGSALL